MTDNFKIAIAMIGTMLLFTGLWFIDISFGCVIENNQGNICNLKGLFGYADTIQEYHIGIAQIVIAWVLLLWFLMVKS